MVPADVRRLGARAQAGAARARQPARHALDGPLGARRRHPRHRRRRPRSATAPRTAASGCRCPTPSGSSTTSTSARRSSSSDARALARRPRRRRRPRAARAARLGPRALERRARSRAKVDNGQDRAGAGVHAARGSTRRERSASRRCAARSSSLNFWQSGARRASTRRPTLAAASRALGRQGRRLRRRRRAGSPRPRRARSWSGSAIDLPDRQRRHGSLVGHYGVTGYPETFFIDRRGRVVPPHIIGPVVARRELDEGIRRALRVVRARSSSPLRRSRSRSPRRRSRASSTRRRASSRPSSSARRATRRSTSPTRRSRSR